MREIAMFAAEVSRARVLSEAITLIQETIRGSTGLALVALDDGGTPSFTLLDEGGAVHALAPGLVEQGRLLPGPTR